MHGIYYVLYPLMMLLLLVFSTYAIYAGIFKAHRPSTSLRKKMGSGCCSAIIAGTSWFFMYSYHYLNW